MVSKKLIEEDITQMGIGLFYSAVSEILIELVLSALKKLLE